MLIDCNCLRCGVYNSISLISIDNIEKLKDVKIKCKYCGTEYLVEYRFRVISREERGK